MTHGLFLSKKELKEYGVLKTSKKKTRRKKNNIPNNTRQPSNSHMGIRSSSDQGFGTQINRTNDLQNELLRIAIKKAENPDPINTASNASINQAHNKINDVVNYLENERSDLDRRLRHIQHPNFRPNFFDSDGNVTTSFSSNQFRDQGFREPEDFDPNVDKTFPSDTSEYGTNTISDLSTNGEYQYGNYHNITADDDILDPNDYTLGDYHDGEYDADNAEDNIFNDFLPKFSLKGGPTVKGYNKTQLADEIQNIKSELYILHRIPRDQLDTVSLLKLEKLYYKTTGENYTRIKK
jgi:hypothetical protein